MKRIIRFLLSFVLVLGCSSVVIANNPELFDGYAFAGDTDSMTNIIKCGDTDGVACILGLVLTIMTYGIGVLGVIGIVLSGIQYITSQGDAGKMAKAKNRIIQVVIGLVIYAVMYTALYFLVPGFNMDALNATSSSSGSSGGSGSDSAVTCSIVNTDGGRTKSLKCGDTTYGNITSGSTTASCDGNKLNFKNGNGYSVSIDNVSNCSATVNSITNAAK